MSTALAEREVVAPAVTPEQMDLVRRTVANGATADELKLYLYDCARQGVHPLDKLLHFTKRGGKYTPVTSIDLMRTRAADTGEYAGSDDAVFFPKPTGADPEKFLPPSAATVTVWRLVQGQRCAFTATARWAEYAPGQGQDHMWRKMPHTMLAKCAEGLALRKGFPRQLAGLYAREEMEQAETGSTPSNGIAAPPETVVDTTTGEAVPASAKPAPPAGYHYIATYALRNNGWHELTIEAPEGTLRLSTKTRAGDIAGDAFRNGIPVKVTTKHKPNGRPGEFYLDKIEKFGPPVKRDELPTIDIHADVPVEPLRDDEIPF